MLTDLGKRSTAPWERFPQFYSAYQLQSNLSQIINGIFSQMRIYGAIASGSWGIQLFLVIKPTAVYARRSAKCDPAIGRPGRRSHRQKRSTGPRQNDLICTAIGRK
jgi:hypothetical protein